MKEARDVNLVPMPYKQYYMKQRNKKVAFRLLLMMGFISLVMSFSITFKREQIRKQIEYVNQSLRQGNYDTMVQSKEHILEQESYLKVLEEVNLKLQNEKLQTLRYLEYLKSAYTNALHIQGYDLDQENHLLEMKGYTDNREDLLVYIAQLEETTSFKKITFDVVSGEFPKTVYFTIWVEIE